MVGVGGRAAIRGIRLELPGNWSNLVAEKNQLGGPPVQGWAPGQGEARWKGRREGGRLMRKERGGWRCGGGGGRKEGWRRRDEEGRMRRVEEEG